MNIINTSKDYLGKSLLIITLATVGGATLYAWTGPTQAPPLGNISAPINVSDISQTKVGDIAVNNATHFLDTGTTIPETPAGGNGAVAGNGWPNYSDVAANAVKLAGLTSADILSAQTGSGSGGMSQYVAYGDTTCAIGWTTAYTGRVAFTWTAAYQNSLGQSSTPSPSSGGNVICVGSSRPALIAADGTTGNSYTIQTMPMSGNTNAVSCAVCVR